MAKVHVCNVLVLDNPSSFLSKLEFEITFECLGDLPEDLEWKIIYVGSAESEEYDQVLDTVYVGPVPEGRHKFVFTADPPNPEKIPESDVVGVTVLLITCSYRNQEFIRVGYYVNNDYENPEMQETPPTPPQYDNLKRNILASSPRVTKFKINWDGNTAASSSNQDAENQPPSENSQQSSSRGDINMSDMNSPLKSTVLNEDSSSLNQPIPMTAGMDIDM